MKKPLSDKEILVNTICNNMREIIILSQDKRAGEFASMIIGLCTVGIDGADEEDFEDILCYVEDYLWKMEAIFEFSYTQYVAKVTGNAITSYWGRNNGN